MTLLEKVKAQPLTGSKSGRVEVEKVELVVALLNDEVTSSQIAKALGTRTSSLQSFIVTHLRKGTRAGLVKISFTGR